MCVWITQFKINRLVKKLKSLQQARLHNQASDDAIIKEIAGYHRLASIYESLQSKKKWPFARVMYLAVLRASSMLDDTFAQYLLGKTLLNEAKFRESMQTAGVFASEYNQGQMQDLYREAHAYLLAAEKLNHIQARRLHGLCYINGWGVPVDKDRGFTLVVESIEQENSWDKVPHIFKELGLNKPEFFSALMQRRNKM
jgi:TPR repeat protein